MYRLVGHFFNLLRKGQVAKYKVLVIEDNPVDLKFMARTLEKNNYDVFSAENGCSGIQMALDHVPDVIILDFLLPDINGIEVCTKLKKTVQTRDIPVIFVSIVQNGNIMLESYEAGAHNFICKPVTARELLKEVAFTIEDVRSNIFSS